VAVPRFAGLTARRADALRNRWPYLDLAARLRRDGGRIASMPFDALEGHRHALGEYYVHTQDVARPAGLGQPEPDPALEETLWLRTCAVSRALRRRLGPGLELVHLDGRRHAVSRGPTSLIVRGRPSELLCCVYGRRQVADVTVSSA
jgi:hypothetical protein